jgi:hypothetical protein
MLNVVFIHQGKIPTFLKLAISQIKSVMPSAMIHLISDKPFSDKLVNNHFLNLYKQSALEFEELYFHRSSNIYDFELFCFQRWFILRDFVKTNHINGRILYLDSDVLLYNDILSKIDLGEKQMSVTRGYGPQYSLFKNYQSIKHFTDFMMHYYRDNNCVQYLEKWWEERFVKTGKAGGVCDMTILGLYNDNGNCLDLFYLNKGYFNTSVNGISNDAKLLGHRTSVLNLNSFENKNNIATLNKIELNALHFQGSTKILMSIYYTGKDSFYINLLGRINLLIQPFFGVIKYLESIIKRIYYKLKYPNGLPSLRD